MKCYFELLLSSGSDYLYLAWLTLDIAIIIRFCLAQFTLYQFLHAYEFHWFCILNKKKQKKNQKFTKIADKNSFSYFLLFSKKKNL